VRLTPILMNPPRQLTLDLLRPLEPSLHNFVVGRNGELFATLHRLAAARGGERFAYLWGEPGAGCSHLLIALAAERPAVLVVKGHAVPEFTDTAGLYLIDDVEDLDPDQQHRLFVLMNEVRAHPDAALVAAGKAPPAQLTLREDVRTRLAWGLVYQVHALTDSEKSQALEAHARSRGLALPADVASYLLTHMPRDMRTLIAVLDALDSYALATKRAITIPLVREWSRGAA
jgi:DnaA-homolog protein